MSKSLAIKEIAAPDYLEKVWEIITPEMCNEVFALTRDREPIHKSWRLCRTSSLLGIVASFHRSRIVSQKLPAPEQQAIS